MLTVKIWKSVAVATAAVAGLSLTACGSEDADNAATTEQTTASSAPSSTAPEEKLPTPQELQEVLLKAVDPRVPAEEKVNSVVDGDQAPEIFEALTRSQSEAQAKLEVVDPVLPGVLPDMAEATIKLQAPERDPQVISGVEFVHEDGKWKLDTRWACTLVETVLPEQVPPMCKEL
ncbi:MAG TPA: hypothetical protein K8V33_05680 [Corynebacterium urealyticum]|nr:hypothetical protein [Corynebacterium urealyticum]